MEKYIGYVSENLTEREKLEALAEEASELAKASLKMIRANGDSNNYTPKTKEEATKDLVEEIMDTCSCMLILGKFPVYQSLYGYPKWKRWANRLGFSEDGE